MVIIILKVGRVMVPACRRVGVNVVRSGYPADGCWVEPRQRRDGTHAGPFRTDQVHSGVRRAVVYFLGPREVGPAID